LGRGKPPVRKKGKNFQEKKVLLHRRGVPYLFREKKNMSKKEKRQERAEKIKLQQKKGRSRYEKKYGQDREQIPSRNALKKKRRRT